MAVDRQAEDTDHTLRVEYGLALERVAKALHAGRQLFLRRIGQAAPADWDELSTELRNEVRAGVNLLALSDLAKLEDLAYLAGRLRDVTGAR